MAKVKKAVESSVVGEVAALQGMGQSELKAKFKEVVGEEPRSHNKPYLVRKIAFAIQREAKGKKAMTEQGGTSAMVKEAPAISPPEPQGAKSRDPRLPAVGAIIEKEYKGKALKILCQEDGFEFEGEKFRSLSAIAKKLMGGTSVNGFLFFGLLKQEKK